MSRLEKALLQLDAIERSAASADTPVGRRDARAKLIVTIVYLVALLSFPLDNIGAIILFAVYPIVTAAQADIPYSRPLRASLKVLPFIVFIGIFNPLIEREPMLEAGSVVITRGWVQFFSIILRGLLTVQATVLLVLTTGYTRTCHAMRGLGLPPLFATQLFMVYRYIFVLLQEALDMQRARESRGYGRRRYPVKFWAMCTGQLLLRTSERATRIHRAMLSRGYTGDVIALSRPGGHWRWPDTLYTLMWSAALVTARLIDIPSLFSR